MHFWYQVFGQGGRNGKNGKNEEVGRGSEQVVIL